MPEGKPGEGMHRGRKGRREKVLWGTPGVGTGSRGLAQVQVLAEGERGASEP